MENNGFERPYTENELDGQNSISSTAVVLNAIVDAELDENDARYEEPLTLALYNHQRTLIAAMFERENALRNGLFCNDGSQLFGRYAFLGDGPTTGKSWTAISYIEAAKRCPQPKRASYMYELSQTNFFSIRTLAAQQEPRQTNLILVSNADVAAWRELLTRFDDLSSLIVRRQAQIQSEDFIERCAHADVILVPQSLYYLFNTRIRAAKFIFTRAFIDNWPSINLQAARATVEAEFTWILSSAWYFLLFDQTNYRFSEYWRRELMSATNTKASRLASRVFREDASNDWAAFPMSRSLFINYFCQHGQRHHLIVSCDEAYIRNSIGIIDPTYRMYTYVGDPLMNIVVSMSSRVVADHLAAGRIQKITEMIGAKVIDNEEWAREKPHILRREVPMDFCPVCFDVLKMPALTGCCQNFFCTECLVRSCQSRGNQICPMCRGTVHGCRLTIIHNAVPDPDVPRQLTKVEVLIRELGRRASGRNLLIFNAEPLYGQLRNALRAADVDFDALLGNYQVRRRKMNQFRNGAITTLVVFDRQQLLNEDLSHVQSIFFYNDISLAEKDRHVFMTQKIGRTQPLEVIEFASED